MVTFELSEFYKDACSLSGCGDLPSAFAATTFYYDESGNAHRVVIKNGKEINLKRDDRFFVLGGILAKQGISTTELRTALGKEGNAEIKSTSFLKGNFCQVLRKDNVNRILKLILDRKWLVHYHMVQPLYFACVDIVDSIGFDAANHIELKDVLYRALGENSEQSIDLFKKFKYPRIKAADRQKFLNGVLGIVYDYSEKHGENQWTRMLSKKLEAGVGDEGLVFLEGQDLTPHSWIDSYAQFYLQPLYSWPNNDHVFDREDTIEKVLTEMSLTFKGIPWKRWKMVDSNSEPMIQVSDCVVSLLRKYFLFLEIDENEIIRSINMFDAFQMANFKLLNSILAMSACVSYRLHVQVCCKSLAEKLRKIVERYVPSSEAEFSILMKCCPTE